MRVAEIVHTARAVSISSQVASLTSPDRAALSTRNSNTSLTVGCAEPDARTVSIAAGTSLWSSASRCVTMSFYGHVLHCRGPEIARKNQQYAAIYRGGS